MGKIKKIVMKYTISSSSLSSCNKSPYHEGYHVPFLLEVLFREVLIELYGRFGTSVYPPLLLI